MLKNSKIERTQEELAKLRFDNAEVQKEDFDSKEERLKTLTEELNQAAL